MTVQEAIEHNQSILALDGPRLTASYQTYVVARDHVRNKVLIGGLGAMGVGRMWFPERSEHAQLPGYSDAPEADSTREIDPADEAIRERDGDDAQ